MTKRPEALLILIALVGLIIAGILLLEHEAVPTFLVTVVLSALVGSGVAITPTPAGLTNFVESLRPELTQVADSHTALGAAVAELRHAVTSVTTPNPTTPVPVKEPVPTGPADPISSAGAPAWPSK